MSTRQHAVGDVVFCVKSKNAIVVARQIVEVNTRETLELGVTKQYLARGSDGKVVDLVEYDTVFSTAEDAYVHIVSKFEVAIRDIVDKASESAKTLVQRPVQNPS